MCIGNVFHQTMHAQHPATAIGGWIKCHTEPAISLLVGRKPDFKLHRLAVDHLLPGREYPFTFGAVNVVETGNRCFQFVAAKTPGTGARIADAIGLNINGPQHLRDMTQDFAGQILFDAKFVALLPDLFHCCTPVGFGHHSQVPEDHLDQRGFQRITVFVCYL